MHLDSTQSSEKNPTAFFPCGSRPCGRASADEATQVHNSELLLLFRHNTLDSPVGNRASHTAASSPRET